MASILKVDQLLKTDGSQFSAIDAGIGDLGAVKGWVGKYGVRTTGIPAAMSGSNMHRLWTAITGITRTNPNNGLVVSACLVGYNRYSYPFWGTFCEINNSSGVNISRNWRGNTYDISNNDDANQVNWRVFTYFTPAELGTNTNMQVAFGWSRYDGASSTDGPFEVWNPNNTEDARAFPQDSTCFVYEVQM